MAEDQQDQHEDDDDRPCYRHPDRMTALSCSACERPICTDCAIPAAVGIKCPECAKQPRAARGVVPTRKLAAGIAAGTFVAFAGGTLLTIIPTPYIGIILAYLLGVLVGTVTRKASGGFRDPRLVQVATVVAALGMLALPAFLLVIGAWGNAAAFVWVIVGAAASAWGAHRAAS